MTDYAVGDIQGCYDSLTALLDKVNFNPLSDLLYCVGDLVNRGPKSLETLELLYSLGDSVKIVLGNHDIHLISCFYQIKRLKKSDTAQSVLDSSKASFWIEWLRQQPLMIHDAERNVIISHAGIYPAWSIKQSLTLSQQFSKALKSNKYLILLEKIYSDTHENFTNELSEFEIYRFTVNAFTRMRYCDNSGKLDFTNKNFPFDNPGEKLYPWFTQQRAVSTNTRIIFGHWSSLGLYHHNNNICIDTGCVWGNELTLYNIDEDRFIHQQAID